MKKEILQKDIGGLDRMTCLCEYPVEQIVSGQNSFTFSKLFGFLDLHLEMMVILFVAIHIKIRYKKCAV